MPVRRLNWDSGAYSEGDYINLDAGTIDLTPAFTLAVVHRPMNADAWMSPIGMANVGSGPMINIDIQPAKNPEITCNNTFLAFDTLPMIPGEWHISILRKEPGTIAPWLSRYLFDTEVWQHVQHVSTAPNPVNWTDGQIRIGHFDFNDWFNGDVHSAGFWEDIIYVTTVEQLAEGPDAWQDLDPHGYWLFTQDDISDPVLNLGSKGGDQVAIVGTQVVAEDGPWPAEPEVPVYVSSSKGWIPLRGPQGSEGPAGPAGPEGPTGPPGGEYGMVVSDNGAAKSLATPAGSWSNLEIAATPQFNDPAGAFTRNADGSVTVTDAGLYEMEASVGASAAWGTTNVRMRCGIGVGATAAAAADNVAYNEDMRGQAAGNWPSVSLAGTRYINAGEKVWVTYFGVANAGNAQVQNFAIHRAGAGPAAEGTQFLQAGPASLQARGAVGEIEPGVYTPIELTEEHQRVGDDLVLNNGGILVPEDGLYTVGGYVEFSDVPAPGERSVRMVVQQTGEFIAEERNIVPDEPGGPVEHADTIHILKAGDIVELQAMITEAPGEVMPGQTWLEVGRYGVGVKGDPGEPGPPGGAVISGWWQYNNNTNPPPGQGQVRTSGEDAGGDVTVHIHHTDSDGINWSGIEFKDGDRLAFLDDDGGQFLLVLWSQETPVTGPDGYTTVIGWLDSATGTLPKKGSKVQISLVRQAVPGQDGQRGSIWDTGSTEFPPSTPPDPYGVWLDQDMWLRSTDGRVFVYDQDQSQHIASNTYLKGPKGDPGQAGVISGGLTNQILAKNSDAEGDSAWKYLRELGMVWRGKWVANTTYYGQEIVTYGGALWKFNMPPSSTSQSANPPPATPNWIPVVGKIAEAYIEASPTTGNVALPNNSEIGRNLQAGTDWRIVYTPPVDVWLKFEWHFPQIQRTGGAGWGYCYFNIYLLPGSGSFPALNTATEKSRARAPSTQVGQGVARAIGALYGPGGPEYMTMTAKRKVPLIAGQTYTLYNGFATTQPGLYAAECASDTVPYLEWEATTR